MPEEDSQLSAIWEGVREELRDAVPASAYESWLEPLRAVGVQGNRLYVEGPPRVRDWFERRYSALAVTALRRRTPDVTDIVFCAPGEAGALGGRAAASSIPAGLGRDLDFDRFVIGAPNRFAHAAALAVAELPGEAYNPLFIYGDPGLGKTHLLVSIANYLRRRRPDMTVIYTTAERFTSEFVSSVRGKGSGAEQFKRRYREIGALLIDDIQFLEDKPKTEDEFFHTFNELYAAGSQIVLSSDRPPEAMERLTERLRDRFAWGLTVRIDQPDLPTRVALLRKLAAERAIVVPDLEVLRQIAELVPANLRKLEGALTRVAAFASLIGEAPSPEMVGEALEPGEGELADGARTQAADVRATPTIAAIQQATCDVLHLSRSDLTSPRRAPNLVRGRQLAMYVARNTTEASLAEIARAFNRDHSTVLHSIRTVEKRLEPGSDIHKALEAIHERLVIAPESS
ncbi:MAG TPA: chromosomal replication initiator protein DnaA [Solirubrobacterales bacterium]|nr:chromosomal replication initiator protein DnaA [Solirubrobacterales bacterium]